MYHIYIKHDSEKEMGDNVKRQSKYISGTKLHISLYKGKSNNINDPFIDLGTGTWSYKRFNLSIGPDCLILSCSW